MVVHTCVCILRARLVVFKIHARAFGVCERVCVCVDDCERFLSNILAFATSRGVFKNVWHHPHAPHPASRPRAQTSPIFRLTHERMTSRKEAITFQRYTHSLPNHTLETERTHMCVLSPPIICQINRIPARERESEHHRTNTKVFYTSARARTRFTQAQKPQTENDWSALTRSPLHVATYYCGVAVDGVCVMVVHDIFIIRGRPNTHTRTEREPPPKRNTHHS